MRCLTLGFFGLVPLLLAALTLWPEADIAVSALFGNAGGFPLADHLFWRGLTKTVFYAARVLALVFAAATLIAALTRRPLCGQSARAWIFLLLALLIGPGLIANVALKDQWGRARPHQTTEFGGSKNFTPAFAMSDACARNCSFVSGDAAFGFFLPSFAFLAAGRTARRRLFWSAMAAGGVIAAGRLVMGAHFLSDILGAMIVSLAATAALFAALFGAAALRERVCDMLFLAPPLSSGRQAR